MYKDNINNGYAAVVGAVNIDICAKPHKSLIQHDSNPGSVRESIGGVGRNIAHNLTLLGTSVRLITVLGGDGAAQSVRQNCSELGIDISDSLIVPGGATSRYVLITDENGVMQLAVNAMDVYEHMTPEFLKTKMDVINNARICVADTNIPKESLEYLAEYCNVPLFVDPVSVPKSVKTAKTLGKLHTIKPNTAEAEALTNMRITNEASLAAAARKLLDMGLKQVFITRGKQGVYYAGEGMCGALPCRPQTIVNSSGAGDSFMAAVSWAYLNGLSMKDAAKLGLSASAICMESGEAVNKDMNVKTLLLRSGVRLMTNILDNK